MYPSIDCDDATGDDCLGGVVLVRNRIFACGGDVSICQGSSDGTGDRHVDQSSIGLSNYWAIIICIFPTTRAIICVSLTPTTPMDLGLSTKRVFLRSRISVFSLVMYRSATQ